MVSYFLLQKNEKFPILFAKPYARESHTLLPYEIPQSLTKHTSYGKKAILPKLDSPENLELSEAHVDYNERSLKLLKNYSGRTSKVAKKMGFVVFDNELHTDNYRRRISKPLNAKRNSSKHLLLFGCSYIFGTGVDDNQTLSWHINDLQQEYEAYNNGVGGYGTNDVLWKIQIGDGMSGVAQKEGVAVYTFIAAHLFRNVNSTINIPWSRSHTAFRETDDHQFEFIGSFEEAHPLKVALYEFLAQTYTFQFLGLQLPPLFKSDIDRTARMIARARDSYLAQSDSNNLFVVAIYPEFVGDIDIDHFRRALSREKVHFIDYSVTDIEFYFQELVRVPYDGHPTGAAHKLYAQVLLEDIHKFLQAPNAK